MKYLLGLTKNIKNTPFFRLSSLLQKSGMGYMPLRYGFLFLKVIKFNHDSLKLK
ncbi:hypothetical protein J4210_00730 [Candidatus Woesearchaeota archaeon]|nr:hypothetical protein [Candidatus Woesearchaeota archaeon]